MPEPRFPLSFRPLGSDALRPSCSSASELAKVGADVWVQVGHLPLINPIVRNAVGGEFERLIDRDALQTGFVGAPGRHVRAYQARHLKTGEVERPPGEGQADADLR
jgi:hypothetical protein